MGGHFATTSSDDEERTSACPLSRAAISYRFSERMAPRTDARDLAHRVALAVIGAVLHGCS
jgi:hypothetical protein